MSDHGFFAGSTRRTWQLATAVAHGIERNPRGAVAEGSAGAGTVQAVGEDASTTEFVADVDRQVIQLFALVGDAVTGATHALLAGDRAAARNLIAREKKVDALYRAVEARVQGHIGGEQCSPAMLGYLVAVLRLLPELERSGDLVEHIARSATGGFRGEMSARARGLIERMGEAAAGMWHLAADAYAERALDAAARLDELDDEMDELHDAFMGELATGAMAVPLIIDLVLVGRFYERLGDHAVNIGRRLPARLGEPAARPSGEPAPPRDGPRLLRQVPGLRRRS